jgi:hypothetical protein
VTRTLAAVVALAVLGVAPALARAEMTWDDAGAAAPPSVAFSDIAAGTSLIVAVGTDAPPATPTAPAIYRFGAGLWHRDVLPVPSGASARLTAVALSAAGAVAIGSWSDSPGLPGTTPSQHAIVASLGPAELNADADVTWTRLEGSGGTDPLPATPLSLALEDDPANSTPGQPQAKGVIGASDGSVYRLTDSGGSVTIGPALATDVSPTTGIAGVALFGGGNGLAVGNDATTGLARFYGFDSAATQLTSQVTATQSAAQMAGVAAVSSASALAIDSAATWQSDGTSWSRRDAASDVLHDAAQASVGGQVVTAVAGDNTSSAWGIVRKRSGTGPWTIYQNVAPEAAAVAISPSGELWVAGASGVIVHLVDHPSPPPTPSDGGSSTTTTTTPTGSSTPPAAGEDTSSSEPESVPGLDIQVSEPPSTDERAPAKRPARRGKPLLRHVSVTRSRRGLIITFTLRKPARVAVVARRGKRVVARTRMLRLRRGRRTLLLPYTRTKLPTKLRIVARPVRKTGQKARK